MKNPGRVLSRQQLMDVTHGTGWHAYERTVDAQISRLRKKLEADPKKPKLQCTATVTCLPRVCRGKARRKTDDRFPDFTVRVSARQRLREFLSSRCSHVSWRA
ncbi:MAG: helix-turn-helix domain-containing protein [Pseudolabrys sp.]